MPVETVRNEAGLTVMRLPESRQRQRQGFGLTDCGADLIGALDEATYCIECHHQGKDSCSRGLTDRRTGEYLKSPFGVVLTGCPLEEKISESNGIKAAGHPVGALALIVVDNPLCAATGHRICNDCMKACIYQKQEPVDIPQVETRTLKDVLELPWGFEVYSLLTRWNPLDLRRPMMRPDSGYKVLVAGLGPAGFTLAHHLMNDGHTVVGIDGLKIEPLPADLSGVLPMGRRVHFRPIRQIKDLWDHLDDRIMAGFGGVAEYGITVRWDKNFLKVIRLLLERRRRFVMVGGVRFGGTLSVDDAFDAGFDHIALCMGAGRPTVIPMRNGLARGVRQASDFLMGLQLTGAAKEDSVANLEIRLPVVVVGGGLTAIDTATEALAYYPVQVEKFLRRYETLALERGEASIRSGLTEEERLTADEFIDHARLLRDERELARAEARAPRLQRLLDGWGGATVAYRRRLADSPSYTLNHEEVAHGMAEGIRFLETATPLAVEVDRFGHASGLRVDVAGAEAVLPARSDPDRRRHPAEHGAGARGAGLGRTRRPLFPGTRRGRQSCDTGAVVQAGNGPCADEPPSPTAAWCRSSATCTRPSPATWSRRWPGRSGAIRSCRAPLARLRPTVVPADAVIDMVNHDMRPIVHDIVRLTPDIVEVVVKAPRAAARFQPGQFYRLQNFETLAHQVDGTTLAMEGLALTGASVDKAQGLLSLIVMEMGGSSDLCALLKAGDPVILMGPTGSPTEIPEGETVCLAGGGLGNAVLFSIGQACRERGNRVVYFAGYKKLIDRYKVARIEAAADVVVWCSDQAPGFTPGRPQDRSFTGNIVEAMRAYAMGELGPVEIPLGDVDRIVAIGSDRMMQAVASARHGVLSPYLKPGHVAIGSINSPMQCMMKEICAQCLQEHHDPVTGEKSVVFSCFNQDQDLDRVDFAGLNERLRQNSVQEKLTALWIDRCLKALQLRRHSR